MSTADQPCGTPQKTDRTGPKTKGQILYGMYQKIFGTIFAPTWWELTEESRLGWENLEHEHSIYARTGRRDVAGWAPFANPEL